MGPKNTRRVTTGKHPQNNHTLDVIYGYDEARVERTAPIQALVNTMFDPKYQPQSGYFIIIMDGDLVVENQECLSKHRLVKIAQQYQAVLDIENI